MSKQHLLKDFQYSAWIARTMEPILFLLLLRLLYKEGCYLYNISHPCSSISSPSSSPSSVPPTNNKHNTPSSRDHVHYFYLSTIAISATIPFTWFLTAMPGICITPIRIAGVLTAAQKVSVTFFQIGRLQNTFSADQANVGLRYGYHPCTFTALYIIGILFAMTAAVLEWLGASITTVRSYGCFYDSSVHRYQYDTIVLNIIIVYYLWDILVLVLYIVKVIKIKKDLQNANSAAIQSGLQNIHKILQKIITLTVIYEMASCVYVASVVLVPHYIYTPYPDSVRAVCAAFDVLMPVCTIYLMVEHHDEQYVYLMQRATSLYDSMWCICKCIRNRTGRGDRIGDGDANRVNMVSAEQSSPTNHRQLDWIKFAQQFSKRNYLVLGSFCCVFMSQLSCFVVVLFVLVTSVGEQTAV